MMTSLRVSALPADQLDRIRAAGVDDFGNPVSVTVNRDGTGTPLRCCLRDATVGERVALIAWRPATVPGPYAEVGPVFVHADSCPGWTGPDYPEDFRRRRQLLRSYDEKGRVVDNRIVESGDAERELTAVLERADIAYVHSRNVLAGCYMFRVDRG